MQGLHSYLAMSGGSSVRMRWNYLSTCLPTSVTCAGGKGGCTAPIVFARSRVADRHAIGEVGIYRDPTGEWEQIHRIDDDGCLLG